MGGALRSWLTFCGVHGERASVAAASAGLGPRFTHMSRDGKTLCCPWRDDNCAGRVHVPSRAAPSVGLQWGPPTGQRHPHGEVAGVARGLPGEMARLHLSPCLCRALGPRG